MSKLLLDYAFSFTEVEGTPAASLEYIHNVGVIVKSNIQAEIESGSVSLDVTELSTNAEVGTVITATAAVVATSGGHVHYEWELTGDSDGLGIEWDNATDGSVATITTVDGFDQVQSGVCTLTCNANGVDLESADITITRVDPETLQLKTSRKAKTVKLDAVEAAPVVAKEDVTEPTPPKVTAAAVESATPLLVTIYSYEDVKKYTDNTEIKALFDTGMDGITLLVVDDLTQLSEFKENEMGDMFTLLGSSDFETQDFIDNKALVYGFKGDWGFATPDSELAKTIAVMDRTVAFYDTVGSYVGCYEAFGSLVSATYWSNQQYTRATNDTLIGAVDQLGLSNDLFAAGVSFWMYDSSMGTYLASFFAGLNPIANDYVIEEIETVQQSTGLNWISTNKPTNTTGNRMRLSAVLNSVLAEYTGAPYYYLNPDYANQVNVYSSNERYHVNGEMDICIPDPIWKVDMEVTEVNCS